MKQFYHDFMLLSALGITAIGILAIVVAGMVIRGRSRRAYQDKLSQVGLLYDELRERISGLVTDRYTDRFLELSEKREKLAAFKSGMAAEADRLMGDMRSLLSELAADSSTQS